MKRVDKVAQQLLDQGQGALMFPNVYETLRANATVLSLVGENIGRHGSLQQSVQPPYITGPTSPASRKTRSAVRPTPTSTRSRSTAGRRTTPSRHAGARRARCAGRGGIANRVVVDLREPDTKLYRVGIDADFITNR